MNAKETFPDEQGLSAAAEWQINTSLIETRTPSQSARLAEWVAEQHGFSKVQAALYIAMDLDLLTNSSFRKSIRQMEAGELEEVVLPEA